MTHITLAPTQAGICISQVGDGPHLARAGELSGYVKDGTTLTTERDRVVEIGREMNRLGGLEAMQVVAMAVRTILPILHTPSETRGHPQEIDCAWDGIGDWRW